MAQGELERVWSTALESSVTSSRSRCVRFGIVGRRSVSTSSVMPWHFESCKPSMFTRLPTPYLSPWSVIPLHLVRSKCLSFLAGTTDLPLKISISASLPSRRTWSASSLKVSQFIRISLSKVFFSNKSCMISTSSHPRTSPARRSLRFGQHSTTFRRPRVSTLLHHETFKCSILGQL